MDLTLGPKSMARSSKQIRGGEIDRSPKYVAHASFSAMSGDLHLLAGPGTTKSVRYQT